MSFHILLVEDEASLADTMALNLRSEGYACTIARRGSEALEQLRQSAGFDLVLLDVMLPDASGYELCEQVKKQDPECPVIFLTAKALSTDKIKGLGLGADDYITKPFDLEEVLLRIRNLLKRVAKPGGRLFRFKGGEIDFSSFEIRARDGQKHMLSRREIGLLELLTSRPNQVVSRDEILEKLWQAEENASARTIDNYILAFRKYFEASPKSPEHFHSVRGVGYKFTA